MSKHEKYILILIAILIAAIFFLGRKNSVSGSIPFNASGINLENFSLPDISIPSLPQVTTQTITPWWLNYNFGGAPGSYAVPLPNRSTCSTCSMFPLSSGYSI